MGSKQHGKVMKIPILAATQSQIANDPVYFNDHAGFFIC